MSGQNLDKFMVAATDFVVGYTEDQLIEDVAQLLSDLDMAQVESAKLATANSNQAQIIGTYITFVNDLTAALDKLTKGLKP